MSVETVSVPGVDHPSPHVPSQGPVRICSRTGLVLVRHPDLGTWRVFKEAYGPLKGRPRTTDNPADWNRFDLPGEATLYTSTLRQGAYAEVLAQFRPRLDELTRLANEVFDDVPAGANPIHDEWCERGHMLPGNIPRIWHNERRIAQIAVPTPGWYVDVEHLVSLQVLRTQLAGLLQEHNVPDMDVSVIRGHNRVITCGVAEWVTAQYLEDGSVPFGIRYSSRHGTDWECWATFPDTRTVAVETRTLDLDKDADLQAIVQLLGLVLHK